MLHEAAVKENTDNHLNCNLIRFFCYAIKKYSVNLRLKWTDLNWCTQAVSKINPCRIYGNTSQLLTHTHTLTHTRGFKDLLTKPHGRAVGCSQLSDNTMLHRNKAVIIIYTVSYISRKKLLRLIQPWRMSCIQRHYYKFDNHVLYCVIVCVISKHIEIASWPWSEVSDDLTIMSGIKMLFTKPLKKQTP